MPKRTHQPFHTSTPFVLQYYVFCKDEINGLVIKQHKKDDGNFKDGYFHYEKFEKTDCT